MLTDGIVREEVVRTGHVSFEVVMCLIEHAWMRPTRSASQSTTRSSM